MSGRRPAALGFKAHTGWAAVVALAGPPLEPEVALKRRVEIEARFEAGAVYHTAQGLEFAEADALIRSSEERFEHVARVAIAAIVAELRARGLEPVASAVIGRGGKPLPQLDAILRSHPLIHAAEGALFRTIIARASQACGIPVAFIPAKELPVRSARALALSKAQVLSKLAVAGKASGRPWAQDEKESALAAWITIAEAPPGLHVSLRSSPLLDAHLAPSGAPGGLSMATKNGTTGTTKGTNGREVPLAGAYLAPCSTCGGRVMHPNPDERCRCGEPAAAVGPSVGPEAPEPPQAAPVRHAGIVELAQRLGRGRNTIRDWYVAGKFPAPHYCGPLRCWYLSEIEGLERARPVANPAPRRVTR